MRRIGLVGSLGIKFFENHDMKIPAQSIASALLITAALALPAASAAAADSPTFTVTQLKPPEVPDQLREESMEVVQAIRWKDRAGDNIVVLSQSGETWVKDGVRAAALRAKHFLQSPRGDWTRTWQVADAVEECQVDLDCSFVKNSLALSDIDGDGIAEVSFVYRVDCFGGLDPIAQKLMLFHRGTKYAIRGRTVVHEPGGRALDPEYFLFDEAFKKAPPGLLHYAIQKWRRFQDHGLPGLGRP